jgi:hypothetical protein
LRHPGNQQHATIAGGREKTFREQAPFRVMEQKAMSAGALQQIDCGRIIVFKADMHRGLLS